MSEHELWNEMGNLYFMSGAYEQAVQAYLRSIQTDSLYGRPYSNLASTYMRQGKYDEAVQLFRRSLDLLADKREKAISWNRLGTVYRQLKDYEHAVIAFQCADELDPECREAGEEPTQMLYTTSDPSIVLQANAAQLPDLQEAAESDPDQEAANPASEAEIETAAWIASDSPQSPESLPIDSEDPSLTNWLEVESSRQDMDRSSAFGEEMEIYLPSTDVENPENEFGSLDEEAVAPGPEVERDEARNEFIESGSMEPVNLQPAEASPLLFSSEKRLSLSGTEQWSGRIRQDVAVDVEELPMASFVHAETCEEEAHPPEEKPIQIASTEPAPAAASSQESADLEVEIAKYKRVVQINDRNASAWDALGTLYKSAGMYQEAILAHQQAIAIDPARASYHHHLGLAYAGAERDEDAITAFQKVIELDPDHYLAHATLGGYYRKLGLEELAQKHIGKAMRYIYDSESEYNRACLEAICGNIDQAIDLLRTALEKKQTYVEWIIHDPDLDFIREDLRFKQLISNYTK
ncbi:MAG TPA: tetratricopeptide repeat protein [Anaerolineales bacterium]|nr:tetratricopeptide repeat protein [Anaerolineales bacterium]